MQADDICRLIQPDLLPQILCKENFILGNVAPFDQAHSIFGHAAQFDYANC